MSVVAVIPARGGSKGVPRKNVLPVGGVPLIGRAVRAARTAASVDLVAVSTDDAEIAAVAREFGAEVIDRPADLAVDHASSESALLQALDDIEARGQRPEVLVFLQATSPFIDPAALDGAVRKVRDGEADVVFSGIETWGFLWRRTAEGAVGINHDAAVRPRRQDREAHVLESGAFYVMRVDGFRRAGHRFFGRVAVELVPESTAIEIDSPEQLELAQALAAVIDGHGGAIDVDAVVTDFDGVHTDDRAVVGIDGAEHVVVSRSDGMGVRLLREADVPVLILSTEKHPVVASRAAKLGVEVIHGSDDKATALSAWAKSRGIPLDRIAYLGNDVNDLGCLRAVGWPVVVPDAHPLARAAARVVLDSRGGHGAVRELAERVLDARKRATP